MNHGGAARVIGLAAVFAVVACVRDVWVYDGGAVDAGGDVAGAEVTLSPPRPLAPLSLGGVTQLRPTLRWALSAGHDGASVELCRDRACTNIIETLTATGTSARPTRDLPPRSVVFWRLRGRAGSVTDAARSPTWLFHVPAASASTAVDTSASPHLDVNGDGYDDVLIGAYTADPNGRRDAGVAKVFHGGPGGVSPTAARVLEGVEPHDRFGVSVRSAGDVDGDGYGDVIIGATALDGMPGSAGSASVYLGGPTGLGATPQRVLRGVAVDDGFGFSVAGAGDVDGDGYADVIVGAYGASPGGRSGVGATSVFHGSAAGIGETATRVLEGAARGERFGYTVATAGDVNGDGFSDVAVTAVFGSPGGTTNAGTVSVFLGSASGLPMAAARVARGGAAGDQFGNSLSGAGDVNGDGYSDLVVGANGSDPGGRERAGTASVFHGSASGIPLTPAVVLGGLAALDFFSFTAGAGDLDGDGFDDLAVGAAGASPGGRRSAGALSVFHGSATGIPMEPARVIDGASPGDLFGNSVSSAGDVDGDGYADLVVGAWQSTRGGRAMTGVVSVFHGGATGLPATAVEVYEGDEAGDQFGVAVAARARRSARGARTASWGRRRR